MEKEKMKIPKWRMSILGLAVLTAMAAAQARNPSPEGRPAQQGSRELRVLDLKGNGYERGLEHGRRLKAEIAKLVKLWKDDLGGQSGQDPDAIIKRFLSETAFTPAIEKWTPDILDEVRGIADGAGQPFETMFAFQLVDEIWVYLDAAAHHCSGLGVARSGGHPAFVAQNMDLEAFRDGFQIVLHIAGDDARPEQYVFSFAGLVGVNGINARSIAIACNTLLQLSASSDGLPVAFVVRGVLARTSGDEALRFVREVRHASGQNYIIGAGDRVCDLEASAHKVVEFKPFPDGRLVYHTNHPLANDDLKPWAPTDEISLANTRTRLAAVRDRLGSDAAAVDEDAIKTILRSKDSAYHPVCRTLRPGAYAFTFGATIMTLSGTPSLDVTMGPPDANPFARLLFDAKKP
jgi:isopenicillin-N N-acyltransferase-like protein